MYKPIFLFHIRTLSFIILFFSVTFVCPAQTMSVQDLHFNPLSTASYDDLSSNEVTCILQDKSGFIWIGTNYGLCRYDGYSIKTYMMTQLGMRGLYANYIKSLAQDKYGNLYVGTLSGLGYLDMKTGKIELICDSLLRNQQIWPLNITPENEVWIGSGELLYRYFPDKDSLTSYHVMNVKTILRDSKNRLWFGTWRNGLYRYDAKKNHFIRYPSFNKINSVHVLFEDSHHNMWAGTWNEGLYKLEHIDSPQTMSAISYRNLPGDDRSLTDDIVYAINEDSCTNTLWVGTRGGLSILDLSSPQKTFINYTLHSESHRLPYNEVDAITRDRDGMIWLGMMGGGVFSTDMTPSYFARYAMSELPSKSVRSLFMDSNKTLWVGVGSYGLALKTSTSSQLVFFNRIKPLENGLPQEFTADVITQRPWQNEILIGTFSSGVYYYNMLTGNVYARNTSNTSWIKNNGINSILCDSHRNTWYGSNGDFAVELPTGKGINLAQMKLAVTHGYFKGSCNSLIESADGAIWAGTSDGIFRLSHFSNQMKSLKIESYSIANGKTINDHAECLFQDHKGRLWLGSNGDGIAVYDRDSDAFVFVNERFGLLCSVIYSIQEDRFGVLWMGTNIGLLRLSVSDDCKTAQVKIYTTSDGLTSNNYNHNASAKGADGELFFGGHNGFNSFEPPIGPDFDVVPKVAITNLYINNICLSNLSEKEKNKISKFTVEMTDSIVLNYKQNHFMIEFSSLSYVNPSHNKYSYKLDGYDKKWIYSDASNRVASYNNLPAGKYIFHLRGSNENGLWSKERILKITILPPIWATIWAKILYVITFVVLCYIVLHYIRNRVKRRQAEQLRAMERAKTDEMNAAKLQFFTNVTHELLTPLTIISASLDELRIKLPEQEPIYKVMYANVNRLIRLIQQILEFRKAESGNLKLKVSKGDLASFVREKSSVFLPLMEKKHMHLLVDCPSDLTAYFDSDKMDKVLYNLLSNAAKYNRDGGTIKVKLEQNSPETATLSVEDNGLGISKEAMGSIFKRFYEGDYRRFNTIGAGIGLSLTKDLVTLHNGTIRVESENGKGAKFIVSIPIEKEAYAPEQCDEAPLPVGAPNYPANLEEESDSLPMEEGKVKATILLVEDDSELQLLITNLLSTDYHILTANEGLEAQKLLKQHDIDLIVTDVMMSKMDGIELCKFVKGNIDYCHIPVLVLTAKNHDEDKIEAYDSGADGYITKPFNISLLHSRIRNLLQKKWRTANDFKKQIVFEAQSLDYTSLDEDFLQRAINCVYKHLDDAGFDQTQFIEEMRTSKSTLYKKLRSLTGLNTSAFIRNIRLKAACQIMDKKKKMQISELAYAVGFNDPKYFSTSFKKEFGLLPTEYMDKISAN